MPRQKRVPAYIAARALGALSIVILVAVLVLRVYVVSLAKRAQALQQQVFALKPGSSGLDNVRRLAQKGGRLSPQCSANECYASITISTMPILHGKLDSKLLRALGIRPVQYFATVDVRNGVVSRLAFGMFYRTVRGTWLSGSTSVLDELSKSDRCLNFGLLRHPEYVLVGDEKQPGARIIRSGVTLGASAEEYRHAEALNLSCASALRECGPADLMPLAYSDWLEDSKWEHDNRDRLIKEESACQQKIPSSPVRPVPWWATGWQSAEN